MFTKGLSFKAIPHWNDIWLRELLLGVSSISEPVCIFDVIVTVFFSKGNFLYLNLFKVAQTSKKK